MRNRLQELVDHLAAEIEEAFDQHVLRDAGPGAGMPMGVLGEDPHVMAEQVLREEALEVLEQLGWELPDS